MGFHVGDEQLRPANAYGHPVSYRTHLLQPDGVTKLLRRAGLIVTAQLVQEPDRRVNRRQACLLARRPERS